MLAAIESGAAKVRAAIIPRARTRPATPHPSPLPLKGEGGKERLCLSFREFLSSALRARAEAAGAHDLRRVLGRFDLVALGIGAVIGAGIFVLTGHVAGANAGPGVVLSMLVAGFVSALAGLCYAELAASVPVSGSAYTYAYATLGELIAWIIGWDLVLEYALSAATVSVGWSGHLTSLLRDLGIPFPAALSAAPGTLVAVAGGDPVTAIVNLPAILLVIAVTALLVVGIRESASINTIMVAIKVGVVLADRDRRGLVHHAGELDAVRAGQHGHVRRIRVERRDSRRRDHLLRLHRLRRRLDDRAGGEGSAARHAVRHSRLARRSARCSTCSPRASWWGSRRMPCCATIRRRWWRR